MCKCLEYEPVRKGPAYICSNCESFLYRENSKVYETAVQAMVSQIYSGKIVFSVDQVIEKLWSFDNWNEAEKWLDNEFNKDCFNEVVES